MDCKHAKNQDIGICPYCTMDELRATIEAKDAELERMKEAWCKDRSGWLMTDIEYSLRRQFADAASRADAAEVRVKEMEGDLNRLIRHRDGEGGDSGFFQFFDRLVDEDTARTTDRIAFLEDGIAGRDTVILRLESELVEAKQDTARLDWCACHLASVFESCSETFKLSWISGDGELLSTDGTAESFRAAIDDAKSK